MDLSVYLRGRMVSDMRLNRNWDNGKTVFSITLYTHNNKWYLPFGLALWNRHSISKACYFTHLVEASIGILFMRIQLQWWRKNNDQS